MFKITQLFGGFTIIAVVLTALYSLFISSTGLNDLLGFFSIIVLQIIAGGFLFYASTQKIKNTDLSEKVYPASMAFYILMLAFTYRWYWFEL